MACLSLTVMFALVMVMVNGKRLWNKDDLNIGYDFETEKDLQNTEQGLNDVQIVGKIHKHGTKSLQWNWKINTPLKLDLTSQYKNIQGKRKVCGIHFWIHQNKPVNTDLRIKFHTNEGRTFSFRIDLNFRNWRAIARTFAMSNAQHFKGTRKISFVVEDHDPLHRSGILHLDLIRISLRCVGWTYDFVNPPQIPLPLGIRNEIGDIEDLNGIYGINNFWQSMYKWGKVDKTYLSRIDASTPLTDEENKMTKELKKIEQRVDDWYFPGDQSYATLNKIALSKLHSLHHCDLEAIDKSDSFKQWAHNKEFGNFAYLRRKTFYSNDIHHQVCIESAYKKYRELDQHRPWKSLFPSRDVLPHGHSNWTGLKFSEINHRILFPLALEYFISKRKMLRKQSRKDGQKSRTEMVRILAKELRHEPELLQNVNNAKTISKAFKAIDNLRINRLRKLFQYMRSEGWDAGSGLGNTDHLMNLNSGFTHALFLLRNDLSRFRIFHPLLNAARWYNEIGEIHQQRYEHKGSTADKIKNFILSRLLVVLSSPYGNIKESRQKIIDAKHLKRWVENTLEINEGYGGIIKPDFIGYHHKGPYLSAYFPEAIHALSLATYFLHGTSFAISEKQLSNLKETLKSYHILTNANSVPFGVSGAKINYATTQNDLYSSYAYLSVALSKCSVEVEKDMGSIFMKLYKPNDPYVHIDLVEGKPYMKSVYFNSIGTINVFEKVYKLAKTTGINEAKSPIGNWAKPYAALSIHRRENWMASAKGFSKYIWDYESTVDQNIFGRYQSHGQLQIFNGRKSLDAYDVFSGWDWNRVPGTTSIELSLNKLKSAEKCRYFSNSTTVGGLYYGKRKTKNGIFVMEFQQPPYAESKFSFKKSYFFIDDMIVALGSTIKKIGAPANRVITTVFQNKVSNQTKIYMNKKTFVASDTLNMKLKYDQPITFVDANNNGYFIPANKGNVINFKIGKSDNARKPNGVEVAQLKTYASVIFDHGSKPRNKSYEYAVLVNSGIDKIRSFQYQMSLWNFGYKPYVVIQQDEVAHIIRTQRQHSTITAYTIFDADAFLGTQDLHVIRFVNRPCVAMVEETVTVTTIAIMDPDLRMFEKYVPSSKFIQTDIMYLSHSKKAWLNVVFNKKLKLIGRKNRYRNLKKSVSNVFNKQDKFGKVRPQVKLLLSHGLTTEMKFKRTY